MVCIQRSQKDESQSTDGVGTLSKHDCGKPLTDVTFRRFLKVQKNKPRVIMSEMLSLRQRKLQL